MFQKQNYDRLPEKVKEYAKECQALKKLKDLSVLERAKRFRHWRYFSKVIFPLKLIAHNGSRFDLPALQNELFKLVDPSSIKCIRKGASFFSLSVDQLTFLDSCHFVNMSLAKFCQTFQVQTPKGSLNFIMFMEKLPIYKTF